MPNDEKTIAPVTALRRGSRSWFRWGTYRGAEHILTPTSKWRA